MDARFTETGNGGDLTLITNDIAVVFGVENMPYLAMFGGASHWANDLLFTGPGQAFVAQTETALMANALSSQGRANIEQAIKNDLQFLLDEFPGTKLTVSVAIVSDIRIDINILLNGQQINYLWNPKKYELRTA